MIDCGKFMFGMNDLEEFGLYAHCKWMEVHFVVERQRMRMMKMMPLVVMWDLR